MAAPTFKIEYESGEVEEVRLLPKAQLRYEAETRRSLRDDIASITEMYEIVWYAKGKPDGKLSDWIENVVSVDPVEDEDDEDRPTSPSNSPD